MGISRDELKAFMDAQRVEYGAALPGKVAVLEALWVEVQAGADGKLKEFERAAHSIYGASGTYGFREISGHASTLETVAQEALEAGGSLSPEQGARIAEALRAMRLSLPAPP
jgi:HPt (histidine-containing phosphotransfer) domain-containing protein